MKRLGNIITWIIGVFIGSMIVVMFVGIVKSIIEKL